MVNVGGSANVSISEIDLSTRVPSFPGVYGAIVIPAKKGLIGEPTLVTGDSQFLKRYTPNEKIDVGMDNSHFSGLNFLQQSNKLWVNRVANNALYALMLYSSVRSSLSTLVIKDDFGIDTVKDVLEVSASNSKYFLSGDVVTVEHDISATLPQPLAINTNYYLIKKDNGTVQLANTYDDAVSPNKVLSTDYTSNTITVGNTYTFTVNILTNASYISVAGHSLSNGDQVKLTTNGILPSSISPKTFTTNSTTQLLFPLGTIFKVGQQIRLSTTGTLPTGLNNTTQYYINSISTTVNAGSLTIDLSTTLGGAISVFTVSSGSGTHSSNQEIFYAIVVNSNTISIEYVIGTGAIVFTSNGTGTHTLTKPHGLANNQPVQFYSQGTTKQFIVDVTKSTKTFTSPSHGLVTGNAVTLSNDAIVSGISTPDLPISLVADTTRYYVINETINTFELSSTIGSTTAIVFSTNGSGKSYVNTGLVPNTFIEGTTYYVTGTTFNTLTVSSTIGGSVITTTDNGSGILLLQTGFIDLVTTGITTSTDKNYIVKNQFSKSVAKSVTTTNFALNNRFVLPEAIVSSLDIGQPIILTSKGSLPAPLMEGQVYYVIKYPIQAPQTQLQSYHTNKTTIKLAISQANAVAYSPTNDDSIVLSSNGTGINTIHYMRGMSENVNGYETGSIIDNFVINQDSILPNPETIVVSEKFGERLKTGDPISFKTNIGGKLPLPLVPNTTYYVVKGTDSSDPTYNTNFQIALIASDAKATVPITLDLTDNITIVLSTAINPTTDEITVPILFGSLMTTGVSVTLSADISTSGILPKKIQPNIAYYLIKKSDTKFQLAVSVNDAILGNALDFVNTGTGSMIIAIDGLNTVSFIPSVVDPTTFTFGSDDLLLFYSANEGAWGNDIFVRLEDYRSKEPNTFLVKVFKRTNLNIPVETWVCSRKTKKDGRGNNVYIQDVLEGSSYIRCFDNTLIDDTVFPSITVPSTINPNVRSLVNGSDGDIVGVDLIQLGADKFSNTENIPITVLMDGGWSYPEYQKALDAIAQSRQDCVAILSTPFDKEASSDYVNALVDYRNLDLNLNSSYSSLYTPHPLVYDKYNDRRLYISPDGLIGALISATAANYELWFPVAGFKRGLINVLDLRRRFSKGEMDYLYDNGINPIRFSPGKGIVVWGQKTLLSRPSALDRLNVRLLLIVVEPTIKKALENFLFDINDAPTRTFAKTIISSYLDGIVTRRGISDYKIIADDSNNSPDDVDNHVLNFWVFIRPVSSLEFIEAIVAITSNGISFSVAQGLIA